MNEENTIHYGLQAWVTCSKFASESDNVINCKITQVRSFGVRQPFVLSSMRHHFAAVHESGYVEVSLTPA